MRQISVSEFTTFRWSLHEDLVRYETLGFDSIGIWRRKLEDHGQRDAVDMIYESKLDVSSLHWAGGFTGSDGRSYVEGIDDASEAIVLASQLNAGCLIVHPGARNGHTHSHAFRMLESALTTLVPIAEDYGVKLAFEFIPVRSLSPWTFVHSLAQTRKLLDMFPADRLGVVLDLYHVGLNQACVDSLEELIDRVALVQLSDRSSQSTADENRQLLGKGQVDLPNWLSRLDALGYNGPLELELHGVGTEGIDYFHLLDQSRDYLLEHCPVRPSTAPQIAEPAKVKSSK